ncbi:MAG: trigger factor [Nitrospirales bacterium]|nr:trigger factor [Nitrospirales bacterium]
MMKLDISELGPMKRAIKIEISEEAVNQEFDKVYQELKRQVKIPGFRPGKAPVKVLEQRYSNAVAQDVVQRLVPDYYQRAVQEAGVTPVFVDIPPIERMKIERNTAFTFTATVDIKPTIELRDYRPPNPISLKIDNRTVTDEQCQGALETLREKHARVDAAPAGTLLADGLYAVVNIEGLLDGKPVEGAQKDGHLYKVGSNEPVLGLEIDEALVGKQDGDVVELSQVYPSSHPDQNLSGQTVVFRMTIAGIKQKQLPEADDEFAKDCGSYETLAALQETIQTQLEAILKRDKEDGYKNQVIERLLTMHYFDIPDVLIDREVQAMVRQRLMEEHQKRGGTGLEDHIQLEENVKRLKEELLPEAKRRVKLALILESIAEKEQVTVEEEDVQEEIARLAQNLKLPVEDIHRMVQAGGDESRREFRDRLLSEKALQLVYRFSVIQG